MAKQETFIMVWLDESEEWKYFKDSFDEEQFPNGYVDYQIVVENGMIVQDTYGHNRVGKPFDSVYNKDDWNTAE